MANVDKRSEGLDIVVVPSHINVVGREALIRTRLGHQQKMEARQQRLEFFGRALFMLLSVLGAVVGFLQVSASGPIPEFGTVAAGSAVAAAALSVILVRRRRRAVPTTLAHSTSIADPELALLVSRALDEQRQVQVALGGQQRELM